VPPGADGWETTQGSVTAFGTGPADVSRCCTTDPRHGESCRLAPSASEFGFAAVRPVISKCTVDRCAGSVWAIDRMTAYCFASVASFGKYSPTRSPGTVVGIDVSVREDVEFASLLSEIRKAYSIDVKKSRKAYYKKIRFTN
jgi:hypothetical protein